MEPDVPPKCGRETSTDRSRLARSDTTVLAKLHGGRLVEPEASRLSRCGWAVVAALLLIAAVPLFRLPLNFDVSGFLFGARRLLDGAELYVDYVDPNPPLIVFLNVPVQLLASATGIDASSVLKFAGLLTVALSLVLVHRMLEHEAPAARAFFLAALAFALSGVAGHHFLQREHLLLVCAAPYIALVARRLTGREISTRTALVIGGFGAVGFLLKPFYLGMWGGLEILLLLRRRGRRILRTEAAVVVGAGVVYAAAVAVFTPGYLRVVVWSATLYRSYVEPLTPIDILVDRRALLAYALVAMGIALRGRYRDGLRDALLVALLTYLVGAVAIQAKSFENHWYPVFALGLAAAARMAGGILFASRFASRRGGPQLLYGAAAALLVALGVAESATTTQSWTRRYTEDPFHLPEMSEFLRREAGGRPFFTLGATLRTSFPLATETGVPYASRFMSLWTLAGTYDVSCARPCDPFPYHESAAMPPAEAFLFRGVVHDFLATRPGVVIVDDLGPRGLEGFDWVEYFSRDEAFAAEFAHYVLGDRVGRYRLFVRTDA